MRVRQTKKDRGNEESARLFDLPKNELDNAVAVPPIKLIVAALAYTPRK